MARQSRRHQGSGRHRPRSVRELVAGTFFAALMAAPPALAADEAIPLQHNPSGHLTLPVTIDGSGPFIFLFDTGASHTAIAQPVESLGFQSQWRELNDVQSLTTRFEAERFYIEGVDFSAQPPINLNAVVIPVSDEASNPVAGLLGADAILSPRYTIDFTEGEVRLQTGPVTRADGQVTDIGLLTGMARTYRGIGEIRVMLDSGSAYSIVNPRFGQRIRQRYGGIRFNINGVDNDVENEGRSVQVRALRIGGLCVGSIPALEADLDIFRALDWGGEPAMIIGMDILQFATVSVDRQSGHFQIDSTAPELACNT